MRADHPLISLASDNSRAAREALVAATVDQLLNNVDLPSISEQQLFSDILVKLYVYARHEIRERLSTALATADWAPPALVRELALDTYEIAQPVITFCPSINDDILVEVIEARDQEHRLCVAERACIGETVTAKLIDTRNAAVVGTLARNSTAKIGSVDFRRAITILSEHQSDLDTLILRHDLPASLIAIAYGLAGEQTRLALSLRLPARLEQRLARLTAFVVADAAEGHLQHASQSHLGRLAQRSVKVTAKKPTPGALIAALMRGERDNFFDGLASILNLPKLGIEREILQGDPQKIALATRAANFDISIVRTIFETLQTGRRAWTSSDDNVIALVWMRFSPLTARMHFANSSQATL
jgi:uncharacterized protein (DUF2336 family)